METKPSVFETIDKERQTLSTRAQVKQRNSIISGAIMVVAGYIAIKSDYKTATETVSYTIAALAGLNMLRESWNATSTQSMQAHLVKKERDVILRAIPKSTLD